MTGKKQNKNLLINILTNLFNLSFMSQILTYIESNYNTSFLPYGELVLITDLLNSYEPINPLEYE